MAPASRTRADGGQLLILLVGYALIAAALIVVAVDVSAVVLTRRALSSLADGAALAGVQAADQTALYTRPPAGALPLEPSAVAAAVADYLARRDSTVHYPGLQLLAADSDGVSVTVRLRVDKPLPFLALVHRVSGAFPGGSTAITVQASARAPVAARTLIVCHPNASPSLA